MASVQQIISNQEFNDWYQSHSLGWRSINGGDLYKLYNDWLWQQVQSMFEGGDYSGAQKYLADNGFTYSPEQEKWLDNMLAMQDKGQSQSWEQMMRDTELSSTASQLSALGLNVGNVASMGRVSTPSVQNAILSKQSTAEQRLERKQAMTKAVLGLVSHMASAGIGGIALGTARSIAAKMGKSTSQALLHSFPSKNNKGGNLSSELAYDPNISWEQLIKEIDG